ncbi:MAG: glucose-6-phosphate isomerase [Deinococcaceae bacterium]
MLNTKYITQQILGAEGIDWTQAQSDYKTVVEEAAAQLSERQKNAEEPLGWMSLPSNVSLLKQIESVAHVEEGRFSDLIVLGIGGSSLGALTLLSALQHPYHGLKKKRHGIRVHFIDNVDGDIIHGLLEVLDPRHTLVNVISKSGTTTETMAAYLVCKQWLQTSLGSNYCKHIVATTDPHKGVLRPLAEKSGYATLPVPANVGGRFSVFSPVGLFPALLGGLDIRGLLAGAAKAQSGFLKPIEHNVHLQSALLLYLFARRGKSMVVFMPYSSRLRFLADWFVQLWAESLGKAVDRKGTVVHTGTTPIKALGATDQHSQVQLYREGPNDKLTYFIRVERSQKSLVIPNAEPDQSDMNYLAGKSFSELMNAEQMATAYALAEAGRPSLTWTMPKLDSHELGYLMQSLMLQTAVVGELLDINAFDQPGVELGKVLTYGLMGRPGYEHEVESLRDQ